MYAIAPRTLRLASLACAFVLLAPGGPRADDAQAYLELKDGSVVTGELLGIDAAGFQVRSPSLGVVNIPQEQVRVMRRGPSPPADGAGAAASAADVQAMQQRLTGDQEVMGLIMQLQNDPEIARVLADPELVQAIAAGDLDALRDDPRMEALTRHPGIRAIIERVQAP